MSQIKKYFTSRWEDGYLLEVDFSQLEIYVLTHLSQDKVLIKDLLSGADLHAISAELLFGSGFTPAQRKIAKQLSFQLQYGAGAASMAERNRIPKAIARKFIDEYYNRYKGVREYHNDMITRVKMHRQAGDTHTEKGYPAGESTYISSSGRRYCFIEKDSPDWLPATKTSFSPTQIKNYPVQGLATADIVPLAVGKIYRWLKNSEYSEDALLINTIHDSIVLDCKTLDILKEVYYTISKIMENTPQYLKERFNIDFTLPLKVGGEYGKNWMEMTKL